MHRDGGTNLLNGKKILITSCGGLGDLLMFTPALRKLKQMYPQLILTFLTNEHNRDVLSRLSYIDKVVTIQRKKAFGRLRVLPELCQQDVIIFTDWQPQLLIGATLCGVKQRIGIPKPNHALNKYFTKILKNNVMHSPRYAAESNAIIFSEALDCTINGNMIDYDISLPTASNVQSVDNLLRNLGLQSDSAYICLAPFTGMEERNWSIEHVKEFVALVHEQLAIPIILIGPSHKQAIANSIDTFSLVGQTALLEMVELIKRAKLFIGPDSGPMHIAGAVATPVIAMFNKDLPSRWAPRKNCTVLTLALECSPCSDDVARHCKTLACMQGITPQMVLEATHSILKNYS
jgi:ADP-heptose:LPS heptosyltransferase